MKKAKLLLLAIALIVSYNLTAQVGINADDSDPDPSAMLDVKSTSKGFLPPCMTESQMNDIPNPAEGLMIFCTDCIPKRIRVFNGSYWLNTGGMPELASDEVFNPITGKIWKDRNLGASQVATSSTDAAAYGDLYQWGRAIEGHEVRTSETTSTNATTAVPNASNTWDGKFITETISPYDWLTPQDNNLWQGASGTNNPCPGGFRLPTEAEWETERLSWTSNNAAGAFGSPLKLVVGGYRSRNSGSLLDVNSNGKYWSSSVSGIYGRSLDFGSDNDAHISTHSRAGGYSVRCIKD